MDKADYLKHMQEYPDKYTQENYEKVKDFFGVIVLQTNCIDKRAEEIYSLYKKRWKIETFFNYFKNRVEISSLHLDDYYMSEGVSFIMLIVGLLESEFNEAIKKVGIKGRTINDILLDG